MTKALKDLNEEELENSDEAQFKLFKLEKQVEKIPQTKTLKELYAWALLVKNALEESIEVEENDYENRKTE